MEQRNCKHEAKTYGPGGGGKLGEMIRSMGFYNNWNSIVIF